MRETPPPKPLRTYISLYVINVQNIEVIKTSGPTQAGNNWTQQLGTFDNTLNPSLSDDHSGEGQRKHDRKTNYEDHEERK